MIAALVTLLLAQSSDSTESPPPERTLPLTLEQAIHMAERNAPALRAEGVGVRVATAQAGRALGKFDTIAFADYRFDKSITPTASQLQTGFFGQTQTVVVGVLSKTHTLNAGFRGSLVGGASYQADLNFTKSFRNLGTFGNFNPSFNTDIGLSVTQPLLRGFGATVSKAEILQARNEMLASARDYETRRIQQAVDVVVAYWNHYFARRNYETRQFLVDQGKRLVEINRKKLEVGEGKKLDVIEAESTLATREQELIAARNEIDRTMDALKRLVLPLEDEEEWLVEIVPLTEAEEQAVEPPDWREAARVALERRPELASLRRRMENDDIQIVVARNARLPRFDLQASLRFNHLAPSKGTAFNFDEDFYSIGAGVSLEVPIGNRTARYDLAVARLTKIQRLLQYQDLENQIVQEVRNAVRDVHDRREQIEAAREAARLARERWVQEQRRREVGYSTTFQVRDAEAAWQEAQDAYLRALFDYQVALAQLEAAQGTLLERYGLLPSERPEVPERSGLFFDG